MATYAWNVIHRSALMAAGASVSDTIAVPRNCSTMTIITPAASAGAVWKLQSLNKVADPDSPIWADVYVLDPTTAALVQLSFPFYANAAVVLPYSVFGGGNLRVSTYSDVQAAVTTWTVMFSGFGN